MPKQTKKEKTQRRKPTKKGKLKQKTAQTKAVAIRQPEPAQVVSREQMTEEKIIEAFDILGYTTKLDDRSKRLFVAVAKMNNLNPLKREIHAVERKQKQQDGTYKVILTPVTGYEVFIDRAEESGRLQYWHVETTGAVKDESLASTVTIKRKDWPAEFKWTVYYREVRPARLEFTVWEKEPHHMTEKVCISRAFRLCFRDILRGMPFTQEEAETRSLRDVTEPERPAIAEPVEKGAAPETKATSQPAAAPAAKSEWELLIEKCRALKENMIKSKKFPDQDIISMSGQCKAKIDAKDEPGLKAIYEEWKDFYDIEVKGGRA